MSSQKRAPTVALAWTGICAVWLNAECGHPFAVIRAPFPEPSRSPYPGLGKTNLTVSRVWRRV
ncbi:hypothetical protein GCM10014719_29680 [Planomonospora parontospora subsp. antibiotica]|nr:hypothetical protein GCM10014719_29680 [Planomonospora parontospora subsp. antibiotica]GII16068.1 hypothetical protein Ppa05_27940 [Planomonospora parontospora subsp. antibiotica]